MDDPAQLAQVQADSKADLEKLRKKLAAAQSTKVNPSLVEQFKQLVQGQGNEKQPDFSRLDAALAKLEGAPNGSDAAAKAHKELLAQMDVFVHEAKRRENTFETKKKFVAADQTADISARGIAIGEGKPTGEINERIEKRAAEMVQLDAQLAAAKDYRVALEEVVKQIQSSELESAEADPGDRNRAKTVGR